MISETNSMRLSMLSTVLCIITIMAFALNKKIWLIQSTGIFINSPNEIADKYPIDIAPGKIMALIAWPVVLFSKLAAMYYLLKMADNKKRLFVKSFYLDWINVMVMTIVWVFLFDREYHLLNVPVVGLVCLCSYKLLIRTCRRMDIRDVALNKLGLSPLPRGESSLIQFRFYVVHSSIFHAVWSTVAMASTIAYPLAYKVSRQLAVAVPTGYLDVDTCGTVGLLLMSWFHFIYSISELTVFKCYLEEIKMFHPTIAISAVGLFISNYERQTGITENNLLCLAIAFNAIAVLALRQWFWKFAEDQEKYQKLD